MQMGLKKVVQKYFVLIPKELQYINMKINYTPFIMFANTREARWEKVRSLTVASLVPGMDTSICLTMGNHRRHLLRK